MEYLWLQFKVLLRLCRQASVEWSNDNAQRLGASVAFYTLLSLAPIIVVVVAVAAVVYGHDVSQIRLASEIRRIAGPDVARTIQETLLRGYQPKTGVIATLLGLATLALAASSMFIELHDAMNTIWSYSASPRSKQGRRRHPPHPGARLFVRDRAQRGFPATGFAGAERLDRRHADRGAALGHLHDLLFGDSAAVRCPLQNRSRCQLEVDGRRPRRFDHLTAVYNWQTASRILFRRDSPEVGV
jgi:hypothetical protein